MNNEQQVCTVCHGSRINKLADKKQRNENGDIIYHPIECQHCHGTGKEPK